MSEEWKVAKVEQHMPDWGIFTLDHISGYCHAQQEAHSDWHPDLSTLDLSHYLQGLQNHRQWWHGTSFFSCYGSHGSPSTAFAPVSAASPMMPDAPATSKAKACALPPGSSEPYDTLPASIAPPDVPYAFRHTRQQPGVQPMQGIFLMTPSNDFEECTLSDMIADMDSTPSAQGGVLDTSLPCVQVDDASPPPPAQCHCLDMKLLVATGDYRCGTCKNLKVNNDECMSQLNENCLTYKCAFCAEKRRPCAPAASWVQPIIHLMKFRNIDVPPDVEASYGPLAVGTSSISPGENLKSCINSLEAKMDYVILVLNVLAGIQGIIPSNLPGYTQPPAPRQSASPSHHSLSSSGIAITSLGLSDSTSESQSCSSSKSDQSVQHGQGSTLPTPHVQGRSAGSLSSLLSFNQ
ncbi:hypothetical protein EI94DRAFT_1814774 [Lactarius quietus]|nr:hypothetical protein EI94DRAFT_1814774 [Lactarius quietus]